MVVEDNLIHDVMSHGIIANSKNCEQNIRRNVVAFASQGAFGIMRNPQEFAEQYGDIGVAANLSQNLVLTDQSSVLNFGLHPGDFAPAALAATCTCEANACWDATSGSAVSWADGYEEQTLVDFETWKTFGHDRSSLVADPGFRDPGKRDFRFEAGSVAGTVLAGSAWHPARDAGVPPPAVRIMK